MKRRIFALALALCLCVVTGCATQPETQQQPESQAEPPASSAAETPAQQPAEQGSMSFRYEDTVAWDAEYDVVVVGFGGAGAVSSIAAAEEGAQVLLTEKAPLGHEGGNTRYSYQIILNYTDYDDGVAYLEAECEGMDHMTPDIIDFIVSGSMGNADWLESIGVPRPVNRMVGGEYPELPGAESVVFSFVPEDGIPSGKAYWERIREAVVDRADSIDVWFESPAEHLIQDPFSGTVLGVQIQRGGQTVNVRAKNGVVLACGGFENNEEMVEQFTQRERLYPIGTLYNTGDGVRMGIEVGADLWHMNALSGPWLTIKTDDMEQAWFNQPSMFQNMAPDLAAIYVGSNGMRFTAESGQHRHGHINYAGSYYSQVTPNTMYMIFDEQSRLAGPIMPNWSEDNSAEIAAGIIVQADTIAELAEKIGVLVDAPPPNRTELTDGITATVDQTYRRYGLVNQVERYNQYCAEGYDQQFDRDPATMRALETGPFYAMQVIPAMVNTQGGPRRNLDCEILDTMGNPIPNLYGAGELGSMYGGYYTAGGNLAETIFSGRVAGKSAAQPKGEVPGVTIETVTSSLQTFGNDILADTSGIDLADNQYLGSALGMGGDIVVRVTLDGDTITAVEVLSHNETPVLSDGAITDIPDAIVAANSTQVDSVTGATITSTAIRLAVEDAISQAG